VIGVRELEAGLEIYSPIGYFSTESIEPPATLSSVAIEVDENHVLFPTSVQSDYRKTSVEWSIDIGEGRVVPIHPKNLGDLEPQALDERIYIDPDTRSGNSRLRSRYGLPSRLKRNGSLVPETGYTSERSPEGTLAISVDPEWYDERSVFTLDYSVSSSSYEVDILDTFDSRRVSSPERFSQTDSDNSIRLDKFPFVDYTVINMNVRFVKDAEESIWTYEPPEPDVKSGQISFRPSIIDSLGELIQTGDLTITGITGIWGERSGEDPVDFPNAGFNTAYLGSLSGADYGFYLQVMDSRVYGKVSQFGPSSYVLTLEEPLVVQAQDILSWMGSYTGILSGFTGGDVTGVLRCDYGLGIGIQTDGEIYALSNREYSPLRVQVNGVSARNITNYETLEHPAFTVSDLDSITPEYIHAGNRLYFSAPIQGEEVLVDYKWLTEYLKVKATLRSSSDGIAPMVTPEISEIRIFSNHMVI
jgi:hypothetical protein